MNTQSESKFLIYGGYQHTEFETFSLLKSFVEAAGGDAAVLVLSANKSGEKTVSYHVGLDEFPAERFTSIVSQAVCDLDCSLDGSGSGNFSGIRKLQKLCESEASRLGMDKRYALIMPVIVDGKFCGIFAMLHKQDLPGFLRRYPQMYNLVLDRLEITVRHAGLLSSFMKELSWFETMVSSSNDGVVIVDKDGAVVGINQVMEKISGWSVSEAVGRQMHEVFPISSSGFCGISAEASPGSKSLTVYNKANTFNFSISADPAEAVLTLRSGRYLDIELIGLTIRDAVGLPSGWVMTVRDISKRKETERLGKIFLSAMSHELQTPIAVIKGFAGLMSDPEIEMSREMLIEKSQVILEESERLEKMVKQMLEAASIQAGGIVLSCDSVDLSGVAERTMRRLEGMAKEKNLSLKLKNCEKPAVVWGDLAKLEQVMTNLVENAVKYSAEGTVAAELSSCGNYIKVSVTDEGPGVSEEEAKRIFGLFERGSETKKKVRGSGLGLFISKAVIEAHNGEIGVEKGEKGACFYFKIPRRKD